MEIPFTIESSGETLVGIFHDAGSSSPIGILLLVGGPQYRVGSHRQFVRQARDLSMAGYPTMRFDFRGMGDSSGQPLGFLGCMEDIHAAIDALVRHKPNISAVVVYGLCDGASAALLFASRHRLVKGLILANPWVSRDAERSEARLRYYYGRRFLNRSFWVKLMTGKVAVRSSILEFLTLLMNRNASNGEAGSFREEMLRRLVMFHGRILIVLSGNDIVAAEFERLMAEDEKWCAATKVKGDKVTVAKIISATHTFSQRNWEAYLHLSIRDWLAKQ